MTNHSLQPADIDPSDDGDLHIRICHRGRTPLGRYLAECANAPMKDVFLPGADGLTFASITAVRIWLTTQDRKHAELWGPPALKIFSQLKIQRTLSKPVYEDLLMRKLEQNPQLVNLLRVSEIHDLICYSTLDEDPEVVGEHTPLEPWQIRLISEFAGQPYRAG